MTRITHREVAIAAYMAITLRVAESAATVFKIPSGFVCIGHANHDRSSPRQRKQASEGNKESKAFPAVWQDVRYKSDGRVATSRK